MQPTLCSRCKKNVAVVFISRMNEKNEMVNEGLCLKCAAQLGLPQVEEMMKRMGISPEDLENINNEMMQAFGGAEELSDMPAPQDEDDEDDGESGKTATFPFLNRLFGGSNPPAEKSAAPAEKASRSDTPTEGGKPRREGGDRRRRSGRRGGNGGANAAGSTGAPAPKAVKPAGDGQGTVSGEKKRSRHRPRRRSGGSKPNGGTEA